MPPYEVIPPEGNGWAESQRYVLAGIERLEKKTDGLDQKVGDLRVEVGRLTERITVRATLVSVLTSLAAIGVLVAFRVLG